MYRLFPTVLALACTGPMTDPPVPEAPDLTEALDATQVRAGIITDEAATFGGVSAEGRAGDFKIYNNRVQFVIQGMRDGSYYLPEGGGVIDADIIGDGPGNDFVDEWQPALNLGGAEPVRIEVVEDGSTGAAVIRVEGIEADLGLVEGALEQRDFVPTLGLRLTTEYRLEPDSWLLEVTTTMTTETETEISIGDLFIGAPEVADAWSERLGLGEDDGGSRRWTGFVDKRGHGAAAILSADGSPLERGSLQLLTELTDMAVGFGPRQALAPGDEISWSRLWGMAPDMATLTDAALARWGESTESATWTVTDGDAPVPGARVAVMLDGAPFTLATADDAGQVEVQIPTGASVTPRAIGRASGYVHDFPAASYGPYGSESSRQATLAALDGPAAIDAEGRGLAPADDGLTLAKPAMLTIEVSDDLPFTVFVTPTATMPTLDARLVRGRPSGHTIVGFGRNGSLTLPVEPGPHRVLVHRGQRFEYHQEELDLAPGATAQVQATLTKAYDHPGWLLADPHTHASPSNDGNITMEERILVSAAHGIQVHFGTDHDNAADYRPIVGALGLEHAIASIVADEVSPPSRGHFNTYPITPKDEANGGAWRWWTEIPADTEAVMDALFERHGDDIIIQANHPTDQGIAAQSLWREGELRRRGYWTQRLGAIEVLNAADYEEFLAFWWDLTKRGYLTTPVGVSDSHGHLSGHIGVSSTFLKVDVDAPAELTNDALVEAMREGRTVVSHGPWLELSTLPGDAGPGTRITVTAMGPSWIGVDRLKLLQDGVVVQTIEAATGTFELSAESDAAFTIEAEGDTTMAPIDNRRPWAMAGPWLFDADGNGWVPSLPPLEE